MSDLSMKVYVLFWVFLVQRELMDENFCTWAIPKTLIVSNPDYNQRDYFMTQL